MLYKKTLYLLMGLLLVLSLEVTPSSNDQNSSLEEARSKEWAAYEAASKKRVADREKKQNDLKYREGLWNDLQYQQSDKARLTNAVVRPCAKVCCSPACCLCVVGWAAFSVFCPTTVGARDFPPFLQLKLPPVVFLNGFFALKAVVKTTLEQECRDKPAQAKIAQKQLEKETIRSYTSEDIRIAFGQYSYAPFVLALKKLSKKMD